MIYGFFNAAGRIESAHNDDTIIDLPEGARALTDEQWDNRFNLKLVNDVLIDEPIIIVKPIADVIAAQLKKIERAFEQAMLPIINGIPAIERESWKKQEEEARAYTANNAAATPLIDALSTSRGLPKAELVTRIIVKADLFATVSGQLIGKRQALEDQLNALDETATAEDVETIVW